MATFSDDRVARALDRANDFWDARSSRPIVSIYTEPAYRQESDPARLLAGAEACIRQDAASGEPDILPTFWPDFGTISTAAIWGGEIIPPPPGGFIHIHPVAETVEDLAKLRPRPFEETDFQRAITLFRALEKQMPDTPLFIRTPDFQGPMNTLALVMRQTEMLCALYDAPGAIGRALDHIADVLIDYVGRFLREIGPERVIGNIWPFITLPANRGVAVTQDYMPLLGKEAYAEFEVPRLRRIADAFGGVFIHCCGVYRQHLETLKNGNFKLYGLEMAHPQMDPQAVYEVFGDDIAYLVGVSPDGLRDYPTTVEFARHLATQPCSRARYWFAATPDWLDTAALHDVVETSFGRESPHPESIPSRLHP
ncbi:MAG: hypothetical protein ACOX5G_00830 [Kiritimatiellia bacterium]|jgi:hypothetical protein